MEPDEIQVTLARPTVVEQIAQARADERRKVIAELRTERVVQAACIADARRYAEQARQAQFTDEEAVEVYGESNRKLLAAVAVSLLAPEGVGDDGKTESIRHAPPSPEQARPGENSSRYRRALVSIQSHAMPDGNAASMIWTARVALYPGPLDQALEAVPAHLREVIAARFRPAPAHEEGSADA